MSLYKGLLPSLMETHPPDLPPYITFCFGCKISFDSLVDGVDISQIVNWPEVLDCGHQSKLRALVYDVETITPYKHHLPHNVS